MHSFTSLLAKVSPRVFAVLAGAAVLLTVVGAAFVVAQPKPDGPVQLNLKDGATEVALDQRLLLTFAHPVKVADVAAAFHVLPTIPGAFALGGDGQSATFTPSQPWEDLTDYRVWLDGLRDAGGNDLKAHSWHFRTTILPRVLSLLGESGAPLTQGADIGIGSNLTVLFNAAMDATAVHMTMNQKPAGLNWLAGARSARLPTAGLPAGPLTLTLMDGRDQAGHLAAGGYHIDLNLRYGSSEQTVPLKYPALVQIDNVPSARDQSGLQSADAVFEYQTEGGITRFTALFSNAPASVGPVRSGRYISFKLVRHYRGALFLSGLSNASIKRLNSDPVPIFLDAPYYRARERRAPENLYIAGDGMRQYETTGKPAAYTLQLAAPHLPANAAPGPNLSVPEHASTYAYDAASGTYFKTEEGHLMTDALVSQPLHIAMVIVVYTREVVTNDIEDVDGAHARDFETEAGGRADFFYRGQSATGTWSGTDRSNPWVFKLSTGEVVSLPKGLTWIDVVGNQ